MGNSELLGTRQAEEQTPANQDNQNPTVRIQFQNLSLGQKVNKGN